MWKCRNCGMERARRQRSECEYGGEHDWIDKEGYDADPKVIARRESEEKRREAERKRRESEEKRQEAERKRQEAEEKRQEAEREAERTRPIREYQSFLNSAEGKEQLIKIASGYIARRRRASFWSLILGLISILASLISGVVYFDLNLGVDIPDISFFKLFILFTLTGSICYLFFKSLKKRSKVIPKVRDVNTGRIVSIMEAARFLASRDISQNFEYEDEHGKSCVPKPFIPDTSNTEAEWRQKMEHAGKLGRRKKWAEAADEYRKIGNECGLLTISAPAWLNAAHSYDNLHDGKHTPACYRNAVLGYKKLANEGHEGAQEELAEAEQKLAEFLNRNAQEGHA